MRNPQQMDLSTIPTRNPVIVYSLDTGIKLMEFCGQ
jgi:hypothetical protein